MKKRCQNTFEKNIETKPLKSRFLPPFGPPKTSQNRPKLEKNRKKMGLERSLFRDAMETARESSEVNGEQSLLGIQMATHMIRSSLSIYLSI